MSLTLVYMNGGKRVNDWEVESAARYAIQMRNFSTAHRFANYRVIEKVIELALAEDVINPEDITIRYDKHSFPVDKYGHHELFAESGTPLEDMYNTKVQLLKIPIKMRRAERDASS